MSILAVRPDQAAAESARPEPEQPRGIPDDARKRFELLQDCRELVISRLAKVVNEALNKMSEDLSSLAVRSRDADEQRALMDAVSIVRQHRTEIEAIVQGNDRDAAFDTLTASIGAAIAADRTLGGLCDWVEAEAPRSVDLPVEGAASLKAAVIPVVLHYSTADPLG